MYNNLIYILKVAKEQQGDRNYNEELSRSITQFSQLTQRNLLIKHNNQPTKKPHKNRVARSIDLTLACRVI